MDTTQAPSSGYLHFPEEMLLLSLDDDTGQVRPMSPCAFINALAGAMLFELAFENIIDNDMDCVHVMPSPPNAVPQGLLPLVHALEAQKTPLRILDAMAISALLVPDYLPLLYDGLVQQGILARTSAGKRTTGSSYIKDNWNPVRQLRQRIRRVVLEDDLPDPRDVVVISLLEACGLAGHLFNSGEWQSRQPRVQQLIRMELIGQAMLCAIREGDPATYEEIAGRLLGLTTGAPAASAGGLPAVLSAMNHVYRELGARRGTLALSRMNQPDGFDCPSCAWPESLTECSRFDFCENGAKALASEATSKAIDPDFFAEWSVGDLSAQSDYWMEKQGRLVHPMILREGDTHYTPASYEQAYAFVAEKLRTLSSPDQAGFYACGHASNEAAFAFQLLARQFGSNHLPSSINLCHEPSGKALQQALGHGKGDARLEDLEAADAIFLFGHNPGSNHPRMLKSLQKAVRRGAVVVAVNPLPEAGLAGFSNPQEALGLLGHSTPLAQLHIPIRINGDMALLKGMIKYVLEQELHHPESILDRDFIARHTDGFEAMKVDALRNSWDAIIASAGLEREMIERAAKIFLNASRVVISWGLGITQQRNGTATIREIINLMMLRGHLGREGCGLCPMRGHSNILGIRSMGVGERMPAAFLDALARETGLPIPRDPGHHAVDLVRAMRTGHIRAFLSLGGNLAASAPDTATTAEALKQCDLTVMISTKLNRTHATCGKNAVILPCLGRSERDVIQGADQIVLVEDMMGCVHPSCGPLAPVHPALRGETRILAEMGSVLFGEASPVAWRSFATDYRTIRRLISRVVPAYRDAEKIASSKQRVELPNPIRARDFTGAGGKAHFSVNPLPVHAPASSDQFRLMSIRSHDQFNTTLYGLDDRYRGIRQERRIVLMNADDMQALAIASEQAVLLTSCCNGKTKTAPPFYAIPYPIPHGCAAVYFPEANALTFQDDRDDLTGTPASKNITVTISLS